MKKIKKLFIIWVCIVISVYNIGILCKARFKFKCIFNRFKKW